ncbi:uncharacterized protein LOC111684603 [Lucilia cuprina]|uniref:uncharacterized protein LOC111684603 n=1 Tax=Lucilia cuprina TaxID=7375 RepID=UPI001F06ABA2|nr:uncharacterized protein LOC111684603 [Lucilia cuprina]
MPFLEDSGIESEDKSSLLAEEHDLNYLLRNNTEEHMANLDVKFSGPTSIITKSQASSLKATSSSQTNISNEPEESLKPPNTCRILQRKLELKVERAKRNYSHYQETNKRKSQSATLIPISRLSIPGDFEQKPLVDYKSESDDCEEISFFPNEHHKVRSKRQAELSDTFSIQEMTIDSDLESNDSQNLELLTPHLKRSFIDYLAMCLCFHQSS